MARQPAPDSGAALHSPHYASGSFVELIPLPGSEGILRNRASAVAKAAAILWSSSSCQTVRAQLSVLQGTHEGKWRQTLPPATPYRPKKACCHMAPCLAAEMSTALDLALPHERVQLHWPSCPIQGYARDSRA